MDKKEFDSIISSQIEKVESLLYKKNDGEYATDDKLHNFRVAADLQGVSLRQALGGMLAKHTVSLYDMINSKKVHSMEKWDEKLIDHTVYLLLLKAVLTEEETLRMGRHDFSDYLLRYGTAKDLRVGDIIVDSSGAEVIDPTLMPDPNHLVVEIYQAAKEYVVTFRDGSDWHYHNDARITFVTPPDRVRTQK